MSAARSGRPVVMDASLGVKLFRMEDGSREARELLAAHGRGDVTIVVPSLFVYEFMGVAARYLHAEESHELWRRFLEWRINVREIGDVLMRDAIGVRERYGCSLYDAFAPALAAQIKAPLYSSDRRAHGAWPGAVILGDGADG